MGTSRVEKNVVQETSAQRETSTEKLQRFVCGVNDVMFQVEELEDSFDATMSSYEADVQSLVPVLDANRQITTDTFKGVAQLAKPKRLPTTQRRTEGIRSWRTHNTVCYVQASHVHRRAKRHGPDRSEEHTSELQSRQ